MSASTLNFRDLPVSERIQLVEDIWDSIAEETSSLPHLSDKKLADLHRRLSEHQAHPSSGIPWEQVRADLFKGRS